MQPGGTYECYEVDEVCEAETLKKPMNIIKTMTLVDIRKFTPHEDGYLRVDIKQWVVGSG